MSSDNDEAAQRPNGVVRDSTPRTAELIEPRTPPDDRDGLGPSSQISLPSTQIPGSPVKTEVIEDLSQVSAIPSSLTPPPSSQVPLNNGVSAGFGLQRSSIFSPPTVSLSHIRRDQSGTEYVAPTPHDVVAAAPEDLRAMVQEACAEVSRLKAETAHHRLQYEMLNIQASEDAKRAMVEQEMITRQVDALRQADHTRKARQEITLAEQLVHAKYVEIKVLYDEVLGENEALRKNNRTMRRVVQQQEDELAELKDERDMLLNRIRENREHMRTLCEPGGLFHGAMTPRSNNGGNAASTPQTFRATPRQTPRSGGQGQHHGRDGGVGGRRERDHEPIAALLQVLNQENNSAPSTPTVATLPPMRLPPKHTRNVQSMSSLPTTPSHLTMGGLSRGGVDAYAGTGLLPSVDLVPQSEPPAPRHGAHGYGHRHSLSQNSVRGYNPVPAAAHALQQQQQQQQQQPIYQLSPVQQLPKQQQNQRHQQQPQQQQPFRDDRANNHNRGPKSRESTISIDDEQPDQHAAAATRHLDDGAKLAHQTLQSMQAVAAAAVAAAAASSSFPSAPSPARAGGRSHAAQHIGHRRTASGAYESDYSAEDDHGGADDDDEEMIPESQASLSASQMLRRDPHESFEVASSAANEGTSREVTPTPAAAQHRAHQQKGGYAAHGDATSPGKRKLSSSRVGGAAAADDASPVKKAKLAAAAHLQGAQMDKRVGLGIRY